MIGDGQRIAIPTVAEQELAFVIGAPELIGLLPQREWRSLRTATQATAPLHQAMAIQHRMCPDARR